MRVNRTDIKEKMIDQIPKMNGDHKTIMVIHNRLIISNNIEVVEVVISKEGEEIIKTEVEIEVDTLKVEEAIMKETEVAIKKAAEVIMKAVEVAITKVAEVDIMITEAVIMKAEVDTKVVAEVDQHNINKKDMSVNWNKTSMNN